ncbi:MAG: AraC family transcriptional regulator [Burkholderiales bacterium]
MDVLSDILQSIHLSGGVYFRCDFTAPWGLQVPSASVAEFHVVVRGQCWIAVPGMTAPLPLVAGDVAVLLDGGEHRLLDSPRAKALPPERIVGNRMPENYGPVTYGGGGEEVSILCGYFQFERDSTHPLLSALPGFMHVRANDSGDAGALHSIIDLMHLETRLTRVGAQAAVNRLAELLFIQIVRAYVNQAGVENGLLSALGDPQISAALGHMHRSPGENWTLATLADRLGMSRSVFAARFHERVGQTPMQYLTNLRMEAARRLLGESRLSTLAVAEKVGYGSEAAFSKVFKRYVGVGPGAYRRFRKQP